jgi:hypothetical protein
VNAFYQCGLPLHRAAPHRRGRDLRQGEVPRVFPLMIQGPLGLGLARRFSGAPAPNIENGALTRSFPPTLERLELWRRAAIGVRGRPDWVFIKLYCHGMKPDDEVVMFGELIQDFLQRLADWAHSQAARLHFVTAREMVNIVLAACEGREGSPGAFRDHRLQLISEHRKP